MRFYYSEGQTYMFGLTGNLIQVYTMADFYNKIMDVIPPAIFELLLKLEGLELRMYPHPQVIPGPHTKFMRKISVFNFDFDGDMVNNFEPSTHLEN